MLLNHFNLRQQPFTVNYDSSLLWFSENQLSAMDQLQMGIQMRKGFITLTGEAGTGKTTLVRALSRHLSSDTHSAYIVYHRQSIEELLAEICQNFGIKSCEKGTLKARLINQMYQHLVKNSFGGANFVLIIDNAGELDEALLREFEIFREMETSTRKLLQVVLVGKSRLLQKLKSKDLEKIKPLFQTGIKLKPINIVETQHYISHCLNIAGYEGKPIFPPNAVSRVFEYSEGVVHLVNKICQDSLLLAYSKRKRKVTPDMVTRAWQQIRAQIAASRNAKVNPFEDENFSGVMEEERGWYKKEDFSVILRRERQRSDRNGQPLSYILIDIPNSVKSKNLSETDFYEMLKRIIFLITENTRNSDVKYLFNSFKVGVLLVDTSLDGAKSFIEKISERLIKHLASRDQVEAIQFIRSISISSYPLNQVKDFNKIEGTPVVLKNLNFKTSEKSTEEEGQYQFQMKQDARVFIDWHFVPSSGGTISISTPMFGDVLQSELRQMVYLKLKRLVDFFGALFGIVALMPLFAIIGVMIKLSSKGPVFFRQQRVGQMSKTFNFYKFRSMRAGMGSGIHQEYVTRLIKGETEGINGGDKDNPLYKIKDDPRVTKIGAFLRRTSLDELPQLFNVLIGNMSLVGPRPPIPYEVKVYKNWHYRRILEAKPGITGLWQVYGRSKTTFDEMVRLDLSYVNNQSIKLDIDIIFKTIGTVFNSNGAM